VPKRTEILNIRLPDELILELDSLVEKTLSYYTGRVDTDFLRRSKIPRLLGMISDMVDIMDGKNLPVTFENSREDLRKIMKSGLTL